jgi:hypothetical protein
MVMSIPLSAIDLTGVSPDDYLVFYSEYAYSNDGYEEWRRQAGALIPEPTAALVFAAGFAVTAYRLRRRPRR